MQQHRNTLEQMIIGCIFLDGSLVEGALAKNITSAYFNNADMRNYYSTMLDMHKNSMFIDITSYTAYDIAAQFHEIAVFINSVDNLYAFQTYLDLLVRAKQQRDLFSATAEIQQKLRAGDNDEAFALHEQSLDIVRATHKHVIRSLADDLRDTICKIDEEYRSGEMPGCATGVTRLDSMLCGLRRGELTIIGARPSMGKTILGLNIAEHVGKTKGAIFYSIEQPREQVMRRLLARHTGSRNIFHPHRLTNSEFMGLCGLDISKISPHLILNDDSLPTMYDIGSFAKLVKKSKGLEVMVIDYLSRIHTPNPRGYNVNENARLSDITRYLKHLAQSLGISIVLLSQLRRLDKQKDLRPQSSDLRDSGAIEQDADIVLLLHRDDYYKKPHDAKDGLATIIIDKNRNGETGDVTVKANLARFEFVDL